MRTISQIPIAWYGLHFGEEPPLIGTKGSGTVFFAGCDLTCVFCQNHQISQNKKNWPTYDTLRLVDIFLELQNQEAHNINLVSPTLGINKLQTP